LCPQSLSSLKRRPGTKKPVDCAAVSGFMIGHKPQRWGSHRNPSSPSYLQYPKLKPMKHLLTILALLVSSLAMGQWPSLPYNPDDNADGLIGVADLQALLANYGSEFASAVVSEDGESAIVYMGEEQYILCSKSCKEFPGNWSIAEFEDLVLVWDEVYSENDTRSTWCKREDQNFDDAGRPLFPYFYSQNVQTVPGNFSLHEIKVTRYPQYQYHCYCAAKQLPRVEYFTCKASCSDGPAALDACVNDKLIEGWYPLQSQRQQQVYNDCFWQPLWRWAE